MAKYSCSSALYERHQWHLLIFYLVMILAAEFKFLFSLLATVNGLYSFTMLFTMDTVSTNLGIKVKVADVCVGFGNSAKHGNTGTCMHSNPTADS